VNELTIPLIVWVVVITMIILGVVNLAFVITKDSEEDEKN
jgi:hypothetical protein